METQFLVLLKNILQRINVRNVEHVEHFDIILTVRWGFIRR